MKKLLCKIFGHKWIKLGGGGEKDNGFVHTCTRCKTIGIS